MCCVLLYFLSRLALCLAYYDLRAPLVALRFASRLMLCLAPLLSLRPKGRLVRHTLHNASRPVRRFASFLCLDLSLSCLGTTSCATYCLFRCAFHRLYRFSRNFLYCTASCGVSRAASCRFLHYFFQFVQMCFIIREDQKLYSHFGCRMTSG